MERYDLRSASKEERMAIRKRAIDLHKSGKRNKEIQEIFGLNASTLSLWLRAYREKGKRGLEEKSRGRKKGQGALLSSKQEKQVQRWITDKHPEQLKLDFALWTRKAVKELIEEQFGIKISIRTVGDYLQKWGYTPQRPAKRAYEQNDKAVQKWLKDEYPKIKARAAQEGAQIHWGDETGVRNQNNHGRSYAPKGKTPVRKQQAKKIGVNMISSITNQGKVRFMIYTEKMTSQLFISFMKRLIKGRKTKVFFIVDNLRVHHSKMVKEWVAQTDLIEIFYLPSYSPELNPDEYLNCDLKYAMSEKKAAKNKEQLRKNVYDHMKTIQRSNKRAKSYFKHPQIAYAA